MNARSTRRNWWLAGGALFVSFATLVAAACFTLGVVQAEPGEAEAVASTGWFAAALDDGAAHAAGAVALAQAKAQLAKGSNLKTAQRGALAGVPLSSVAYRLAGGSPPSLSEVASGTFEASVVTQYRLDVDPVVVRREVAATFELGPQGWRVAEVTSSDADLWSYGPVTSARDGKSLVIGSQVFAGRLPSLASQAEAARLEVDSFWTQPWSGAVVVAFPAKAQWMDGLIGDESASKFPAVATRDSGRDGPVNRVTVNPKVFESQPYIGQQILLRHEITHVAQSALPGQKTVPLWLVEGLATYVGYRGSGVPDSVIGRLVLSEVRSDGLPPRLPSDAQFDFDRSAPTRGLAYEKGWSVCAAIVAEFGESQLVPFYAAVAESEGTANERIDAAAQQVLGVSGDELLEQWQSWLQANA